MPYTCTYEAFAGIKNPPLQLRTTAGGNLLKVSPEGCGSTPRRDAAGVELGLSPSERAATGNPLTI